MHDIRHAIPAIRILWTENVPRIPPPFRPISSPGIHHAPRPWGALLANRHSHHNFDTLGPEGSGRFGRFEVSLPHARARVGGWMGKGELNGVDERFNGSTGGIELRLRAAGYSGLVDLTCIR